MSLVNLLVEGPLDREVGAKLIAVTGHSLNIPFPMHGASFVLNNAYRYNQSARFQPCLAMVDLRDTGCACAPQVLDQVIPDRNEAMLFRVVVNEIESWLMADRNAFAQFVCVAIEHIPAYPEQEPRPKQTVINLARRSRNSTIRARLVPREGAGAAEGPQYVTEMMRFAREMWDPERASDNSLSLSRCIERLRSLG